MIDRVLIVGGGQAALSSASKLRTLGFDGRITMLCDEPDPPYQRPPLSKKYLTGQMARDRLYLRPRGCGSRREGRQRPFRLVLSAGKALRRRCHEQPAKLPPWQTHDRSRDFTSRGKRCRRLNGSEGAGTHPREPELKHLAAGLFFARDFVPDQTPAAPRP